jgi:hypothetical protein
VLDILLFYLLMRLGGRMHGRVAGAGRAEEEKSVYNG